MKKILIAAAILIFGFSSLASATILYEDTNDYWFGPSWLGGLHQKTWNWTNNLGPLAYADLSIKFYDVGFDCWFDEHALIKIDGVPQGVFEVDTGTKNFDVLGYLNDNLISWTVKRVDGTFWVKNVELTGKPVPEPGTLLLMGLGLVGLAGLGRKKFNSPNPS